MLSGLDYFWEAHRVWSEDTFGDSSRGPKGPLLHLQKEVEEALKKPDDLEEYADLLFLVFDATRRAGFTYDELLAAVWYKLAKNKRRKWGRATPDGPVEHIRDFTD